MNLVDLIVLIWIAWYGIYGFIRGVKAQCIAVFGGLISIIVAGYLYRDSAELLVTEVDGRLASALPETQVELTHLTDLGLEQQAVSAWYFQGEEQSESVPVRSLSSGEISHVLEADLSNLLEVLVFNLLCFIIVYSLCRWLFTVTVDIIFDKTNYSYPSFSCLGAILGSVQGFLVIGVWLFLIMLISPLGLTAEMADEFQNSVLGYQLVRLIAEIIH